jgi:hypothetical protein
MGSSVEPDWPFAAYAQLIRISSKIQALVRITDAGAKCYGWKSFKALKIIISDFEIPIKTCLYY